MRKKKAKAAAVRNKNALRLFPQRKGKSAGASPGSLIYTGQRQLEQVRISLIDYDSETVTEKIISVKEATVFKDKPTVTWINVDGLHDVDVVQALGTQFDIHPLVLEDIVTPQQRPKVEDHDRYLFLTLRMLEYNEQDHAVEAEQLSMVVGSNFLLSFQETIGDVFDPVRKRIRTNSKRIHSSGPDYLAYALMDCVVDHYFAVLEKLGQEIEALEEEVTQEPDRDTLKRIHRSKRQLILIRQAVWPLREVISSLSRGESPLFHENTHIYLRDVYDHTIQVIEALESLREILNSMLDVYLSNLNHRLNEVIKVLTIITTIFIPLSFIAGIYGMNFNPDSGPWSMPELNWAWGYPAALGLMAVVAGVMLLYFKRKKWL